MNLELLATHRLHNASLSEEEKTKLIMYILLEATEHEIKAFLMDGEIPELDELAEQIVDDRFKCYMQEVLPVAIAKVAVGTYIIVKALKFARRKFKQIYNAITLSKLCKDKKGFEKLVCKSKIKQKAWVAHKAELKKWMKECDKTKKPTKCLKKFQPSLDRVDQAMMKEREKMTKAASKAKYH